MSLPFGRSLIEIQEAVQNFRDCFEKKVVEEIDADMLLDMVSEARKNKWFNRYICIDSLANECFDSNFDGEDLMWGPKNSELRCKDLRDFVRWMFRIELPDRDWAPPVTVDQTSMNGMSYIIISRHTEGYHPNLRVIVDKEFLEDVSGSEGMAHTDKPLRVSYILNSRRFNMSESMDIIHHLEKCYEKESSEAKRLEEERFEKEYQDFLEDERKDQARKLADKKALNMARIAEQFAIVVTKLQQAGFPADSEKCRKLIEDATKVVLA